MVATDAGVNKNNITNQDSDLLFILVFYFFSIQNPKIFRQLTIYLQPISTAFISNVTPIYHNLLQTCKKQIT